MTDKQHYTIGELAEAADTTPRTIRYYTAEGLLPPSDTRGRYALYNADHLARLRLIARLKEAYLPLHEIRARIAPLSTEQVQQLLAEQRDEPASGPSGAADYIAQVLHQPGSAAPPEAPPAALRPTMRLHEAPQMYNPAPPTPAAPSFQPAYGTMQAERRSMVSQLALPRPPHMSDEQNTAAGESWRRVTIAPGVELHIRAPLTAEAQEQVEQLIAIARKLFE